MLEITLVIADSGDIFGKGLTKILQSSRDVNVVANTNQVSETVEAVKKYKPDAVILDIQRKDGRGIELISLIHQCLPSTSIIILTHSKIGPDLFSSITEGARGYISKDTDINKLIECIHLCQEGGLVISPPMAHLVIEALICINLSAQQAKPSHVSLLSIQEKKILSLLAYGKSNKEISLLLFLSENTAKAHVHNIMGKLGASNRLQLINCAIEEGLLNIEN